MRPDDEGLYPPFRTISAYDAPATLLGQVLDGEASFDALRRTLFDPASLSPHERDGFRERMKEAIGGTAPGNVLVDLVTNPFVVLFAATSLVGRKAPGVRALEKTKRVFGGSVGGQAVGYAADNPGWLHTILKQMRFLNLEQQTQHTYAPTLVTDIAKSMSKRFAEEKAIVGPAMDGLLRKTEKLFGLGEGSLRSMDPDEAPHFKVATIAGQTVSLREHMERLNRGRHLWHEGAHKDVTDVFPKVRSRSFVHAKDADGNMTLFEIDDGLARIMRSEFTRAQTYDAAAARRIDRNAPKEWRAKERKITADDREWTIIPGVMDLDASPAGEIRGYVYRDRGNGRKRIAFTRDAAQFGEVQSARIKYEESKRTQRAFVGPGMRRYLEASGAMELVEAERRFMTDRFVKMLGKEDVWSATGKFEVDEDKAIRTYRLHQWKRAQVGTFEEYDDAVSFVSRIVGPEMRRKVESGELSEREWREMVRKSVGSRLNEDGSIRDYFPRSNVTYLDRDGRPIGVEERGNREQKVSVATSGRAATRTGSPVWDPFQLRELERWGWIDGDAAVRNEWAGLVKESERRHAASIDRSRRMSPFMQMDATRALTSYSKATARDLTLAIDAVSSETMRAWADFTPTKKRVGRDPIGLGYSFRQPKRGGMKVAGVEEGPMFSPDAQRRAPAGGVSNHDLLNALVDEQGILDPHAREYLRGTLVPRVLGYGQPRHLLLHGAMVTARKAAVEIADSRVMRGAAKYGGRFGRRVVRSMREWGTRPIKMSAGKDLANDIAGLMYSSHQGLNMGSVITNSFQPVLFAGAWGGYRNLAKAYGRAFREYGSYLSERVGLGWRLDRAKHDALLRKHFSHSNVDGEDLIGITGDLFDVLDMPSYGRPNLPPESAMKWWLLRFPMKFFGMGERLNRVTTGHLAEIMHEEVTGIRGILKGGAKPAEVNRLKGDIRSFTGRTQFGADIVQQPEVFVGTSFGDNPAMRQYLSFPLRTFTTLMETSRRVGDRGWSGLGEDLIRMMGISAIIYETGKEFLGADLSHGLAASSVTDVVGGQRSFQDRDFPVPVPPILDASWKLVHGIAAQDAESLRDGLWRFMPAGVATQRLLGSMPSLPVVGGLQKQYADWGNMASDGSVPVFDADGSLVKWAHPADIVLRGIGADLGRWGDSAQLVQFLKKNRERMVEARRQYVASVLNGNHSQAQAISAQFEETFGMPLTVSKSQWTAAQRLRNTPVPERMLDMVQRDVRSIYAKQVASRPDLLNLGPDAEAMLVNRSQGQRFMERERAFVPPHPEGEGEGEGAYSGYGSY